MTVTIIAPDPKVAPARARTSAMVSPCLSRAISPGFDTAPRTATVLLRYSVTSTLTEGCRNTPNVLSAWAIRSPVWLGVRPRSEEHTSELQSLMRISYAVFCLKKKKMHKQQDVSEHKELRS